MTLHDDDIYLSTPPHLPAQPLLDAFRRAGHATLGQVSVATGIARSCLSVTRKRGTVNMWWADHLITRHLNTHPHAVYGDMWLDAGSYRGGRIDACFEELTGVAS